MSQRSSADFIRSGAIAACAAVLVVGAALSAQTSAPGRAPTAPSTIDATMLQLMRGIVYPSSNVIFAAQEDPARFAPIRDPATSPNPLTSTYGGWLAVENAGLALAESANLLLIPGRLCGNGKPVPARRADWVKFTGDMRAAGLTASRAAKVKNQDAMVEAAGSVADACTACHEIYREGRKGPAARCE